MPRISTCFESLGKKTSLQNFAISDQRENLLIYFYSFHIFRSLMITLQMSSLSRVK